MALQAFSGGPQWTLAFLHRMEQSWKDAFVSWFVATSPVWAGLPEALSGYISGATSPYQRGLSALVHALPSAMWFFPRAGQNSTTSWSKDDPVVLAKTKNYSAYDIPEIFADLGLSATAQAELAFLHAEPDLGGFAAPGVNTFVCAILDMFAPHAGWQSIHRPFARSAPRHAGRPIDPLPSGFQAALCTTRSLSSPKPPHLCRATAK